jgi:aryl-alcohol dehydrogenase-like predicted oxidoreductase
LTGAYQRGAPAPRGSRFDAFWSGHARELTDPVHDAIDEVRRLADERGVTPAHIAHAWVVQSGVPTSVLVGPRTVEHLAVVIGACDLTLDDDALRRIDGIAPPGRCVLPQYGADGLAWHPWGPHRVPWHGQPMS